MTVSIEDHARLENVKAIGGKGVEEANVTVKDNAYVGTVQAIGEYNDDFCNKIGKLTAKILDNATIEKLSGWIGKRPNSTVDESEVIVDGGETGKVTVTASALSDKAYINAQKVEIKNNVLLKLKQSSDTDEPNYIAANGVEMTRDDLMRTIGDDAEIWYTDKDNQLQKIVHGKNVCTKHEINRQNATCTENGWVEYGCTYESDRYATAPEHTDQWTETIPATGHHWKDNGDGTYTFTMPASKVTVTVAFAEKKAEPIVPEKLFADVSAEEYYYEAVKWASENGVTGGIGENLFGANLPCTRAQIVTFLWRAAGSPEPKGMSGFVDVSADAYYAKAVAWAVEQGIVSGTSATTFNPDAVCTRAQSVAFLYRAFGEKVNKAAGFSDVSADAYYADAVAWAVENGVASGIGGGLFAPDQDCARGQIVAFLYRAYQNK